MAIPGVHKVARCDFCGRVYSCEEGGEDRGGKFCCPVCCDHECDPPKAGPRRWDRGEWKCRVCGRVFLLCEGDHLWGPYWWEPEDEEDDEESLEGAGSRPHPPMSDNRVAAQVSERPAPSQVQHGGIA